MSVRLDAVNKDKNEARRLITLGEDIFQCV